ncbi:hypothetical protein [Actinosynnema mirum]|uniref:Uncharacterized protein n=1 Tax=Actinosynnema mirum (strain ATCC 29888 / DSM 43827 / JCM 3225 / NBRC 14064 / NCIMB 13271 / NRRL B-12336 / IMRU 3971 / 101) TaxID=446462 RepID=C6WMI9_ACTMD|nr:hypothetical protein [Actinosynnema mirum]ACU36518.1 hypothetical protein Amir_2581 [Actinosynnema mirum DSM 43827]
MVSKEERQDQAGRALDWVGGKLLTVAPPGWAVMDLKVSFAADVEDFTFATVLGDGSFVPVEMPEEVRAPFVDLRHLLHEPGAGTWFSIRFTMTPPDHYRVDLNFEVDPVWDPPIDPSVLADDLLRWPRTPENTPRWALEAMGIEPPALPDRVDYEEQANQVKRVANQLRQVLPAGWSYAQVQFREIGDHTEVATLVQNTVGVMSRWTPPQAVADRFHELRTMTRRTEHGPWFSAKAELFSDGREKVSTNRTDEPVWGTEPSAESYLVELGLPGAERAPDWLRARSNS